MKKVRFYPYKAGSQGCKALQQALIEASVDALRIKSNGNYRPRADHVIINWGYSQEPHNFVVPFYVEFLNSIHGVHIASNKLNTFSAFLHQREVPHPDWVTLKRNAERLIEEGKKVYCRTKLTGKGGEGIVVATTLEELVEAPLYTVGIKVRREYRVHVFNRAVIDVVQKRRRNGLLDEANCDIRNLDNGWVFCHDGFDVPANVSEAALKAVQALGLDFGAVDVVTEKNTGIAYVLEVNTAPGLQAPRTIAAYVEAIKSML